VNWSSFIIPIMSYFREKRLSEFVKLYPDINNLNVLDVGGRPMMWEMLERQFGLYPKSLVILNTELETDLSVGYEVVVGDGCNIHFEDDSFDLVFSNSVIEHVGNMDDIKKFAKETSRVGKKVYIQTPNRWFFVEPHIVAIFIHWLPRKLYRVLGFLSIRRISLLGKRKKYYQIFDGIRLLSKSEVREIYPDKHVSYEKVMGMVKSFIVTDQ